jgi:hypothetical protein
MPNPKQMEASEILKPDTLDEYKKRMAYFQGKLSSLHHSIYFVQKIVDFPFDLFVMPWRFAVSSLVSCFLLDERKGERARGAKMASR